MKKLKMANVLKMAMMTTQGQRQEKAMLMTRAEIYKLEEEMVVLSSSVWMAMVCHRLNENGECSRI